MNYTPGPWHISAFAGEHEEAGAKIEDSQGRRIASSWGGLRQASPLDEWQRYHADAHLIAAAPDLYEAAKAFVENFTDSYGYCVACDSRDGEHQNWCLIPTVETALAKARGEQL